MRPAGGEESDVLAGGNFGGQRFDQVEDACAGGEEADEASDGRNDEHAGEQGEERADELGGGEFWSWSHTGGEGESATQGESYPPGGDDAPEQAEDGGGIGIDEARVADSEVFEADARGDLVVDDAVGDGSEDGEEDDGEGLHLEYVYNRSQGVLVNTRSNDSILVWHHGGNYILVIGKPRWMKTHGDRSATTFFKVVTQTGVRFA